MKKYIIVFLISLLIWTSLGCVDESDETMTISQNNKIVSNATNDTVYKTTII